jgi:hypothetical protein
MAFAAPSEFEALAEGEKHAEKATPKKWPVSK